MTALAASPEIQRDPVARIAGFMAGFSLEATRPSDADIAALAVLPRGTRIYLSAVPGRPAGEAIEAAIKLRAKGFEPVPHVAVRNFASREALDDFVARIAGEAGAECVLVIGGDRSESGPFSRAADAIDTGIFGRYGIRTIGIAGYPDGHPRIGTTALQRALSEKIAATEAAGHGAEIVTQFCFEARDILDYIARLRSLGFHQPLRVGLAGPASLAALLRYAGRCGVRASAKGLVRSTGLLRQAFTMKVPDELVRALADAAPAQVQAHFFSFGGVPSAARWIRAVAEGRIAVDGETGFSVVAP